MVLHRTCPSCLTGISQFATVAKTGWRGGHKLKIGGAPKPGARCPKCWSAASFEAWFRVTPEQRRRRTDDERYVAAQTKTEPN
jgi:hypothetical protein